MKKIIKTLVVFILSCILISANCINSIASHEIPYYKVHYGKGSNSYNNVKIDGVYYDIDLYGKNKKGKEVYSVEATYAYASGKVLKIPNKIKFKGKKYKVQSVSFYEPSISAAYIDPKIYDKIEWDFSLPYETIYLPKNATQFTWNRKTMKVPNFKKIYIGSKIKSFDLESSIYDMPKLKVIIDKKNPYIKMKNGAVYSKNGKKMYCLINSKKKYKIANGTKNVSVGQNKILEKVILPSSVEKLSDFAFSNCKKLKSVKLNKKLKLINDFAFQKCKSLNKIVLPKNLDKIGYGVFIDCDSLKRIVINNNVQKIGASAFSDCDLLSSIILPENIKIISAKIFENCIALKKISIPQKVEKIDFCAFKDCINLSKLTLEGEEKAPTIEKAAFKNTKDGIQFIVKNQTIADQLKEQLNGTGVKNAKILLGKKVVYQNING